jgi:hypothetical protein
MTNWRELNVYLGGDDTASGTLGAMVDRAARDSNDCTFDRVHIAADGSVDVWPEALIAADGEMPDWSTPAGPVDWTGFADALSAAVTESAQ